MNKAQLIEKIAACLFAGKTDPRFASKTDPPNVSYMTIIMIYFLAFFSFAFLVDALNLKLSLPVSMMWQW